MLEQNISGKTSLTSIPASLILTVILKKYLITWSDLGREKFFIFFLLLYTTALMLTSNIVEKYCTWMVLPGLGSTIEGTISIVTKALYFGSAHL